MSVAQNQSLDDVEAPCKGSKGHKGFREEAPGFCAHFKCSAVGSGRAGGTRCLVARKAPTRPPWVMLRKPLN